MIEDTLSTENQLNVLKSILLTDEDWSSLCNIVTILGRDFISTFSVSLCRKYSFAEKVRYHLKKSILSEAGKIGYYFHFGTELMLSEYLSNQNPEDMEPDDIFRNGVTKLNLMFENVLNDAILLETIGTLEIQDVLSSFTKDEINDILQNIPDQKVRDYLKYAIKKTLKKCRKKYKWYNKLNKKWKRIRKEYPYDTTSWRQWDERS